MARLTLDPDRLTGTILTEVSNFLLGFLTPIKRVFTQANKISKEQWDSVRDNFLDLGNKFLSTQKILGNNLKKLEEEAKTNEKAAKLLESYKKGQVVEPLIEKLKRDEALSRKEKKQLIDAFKESEEISDIAFGLKVKKSEMLKELYTQIGDSSELSVKRQMEIANQALENADTLNLLKNKKDLQGTGIKLDKDETIKEGISRTIAQGNLEAVSKVFENIAQRSAKSKSDETTTSAGALSGMGMGLAKGALGAALGPLGMGLAGGVGAVLGAPGALTTSVSSASSLLDSAGELVLLLGILLPVIWAFFKDKFDWKEKPGKETSVVTSGYNIIKSYGKIFSGDMEGLGEGIKSSTKTMALGGYGRGLQIPGVVLDKIINPTENSGNNAFKAAQKDAKDAKEFQEAQLLKQSGLDLNNQQSGQGGSNTHLETITTGSQSAVISPEASFATHKR